MQCRGENKCFPRESRLNRTYLRRNGMNRTVVRIAVFLFAVTLSIGAFAASKSMDFKLYHDVQLNGMTLPAGDYTVKYKTDGPTTEVTFMQGSKKITTANGEFKTLTEKPRFNQVVVSNGPGTPNLSQLEFHGSKQAINFDNSTSASGK